jgi:hypothetical protein
MENIQVKNGLYRVGGVGVGGFLGEETEKRRGQELGTGE